MTCARLTERYPCHESNKRHHAETVINRSGNCHVALGVAYDLEMLLTMSRFCSLFERISVLKEFEGFENLSEMVDLVCRGLYGKLDTDEADDIQNAMEQYDELLEDVFDSEVMCDYTQTVRIPNQPDFVPAELDCSSIWIDAIHGELACLYMYNPFKIQYISLNRTHDADFCIKDFHYKQDRYISYMTLRFHIDNQKYSLRIMTSGKRWIHADSIYIKQLTDEMRTLIDFMNHGELLTNDL